MTPENRVLSDEEIDDMPHPTREEHRDFARAVERAVLENYPDGAHVVTWATGASEIVVPERDARERERAAWDAAVKWWCFTAGTPTTGGSDRERDRRYPPIPALKPEGVTLSDGSRWEWMPGCKAWHNKNSTLQYPYPICRTADDFQKVADYLRAVEGTK